MADKKKQAKRRAASLGRDEMLHLLDREMRQSSGLGVVFSQAIASRLGIGASDLECLDIVALREDVTAGELALATGLTTGAVTGVLDRLEQAGFVQRERDAKDRRKVRVRLLPGTLAKAMPYYRSLERTMKKVLAAYSDAEIALLLGFFTRAREVMVSEIERLQAAPARDPRS